MEGHEIDDLRKPFAQLMAGLQRDVTCMDAITVPPGGSVATSNKKIVTCQTNTQTLDDTQYC